MSATAGGPVPYEEIWVRLPEGDGRWLAMERPDGCLVRVGDHAITELGDRAPNGTPPSPLTDEDPAEHLKTESNEAEWGFTR